VACQGEGDEVVLRRTFGATKDQYFLNKKPINKVRRLCAVVLMSAT
jgi:hypothetical protein